VFKTIGTKLTFCEISNNMTRLRNELNDKSDNCRKIFESLTAARNFDSHITPGHKIVRESRQQKEKSVTDQIKENRTF
jgi:hypothetical protein